MWPGRKRTQPTSVPFPIDRQRVVERECAFYHLLPENDRAELARLIQTFLSEKSFEGCGGLRLNADMALLIAAQACLLLLHRETDHYPGLKTVLLYPGTFAAPIQRHVGSGVMEEGHQLRAGEAWQEGAIVLAWDAVQSALQDPEEGRNVVWHEFAHQLDFENGQADGVPLLGRGQPLSERNRRYANWSRVMRQEYAALRQECRNGEPTVLRPYAATNPAEFFAVATECFFGKASSLHARHPELYEQLKAFYQQDPLSWLPD